MLFFNHDALAKESLCRPLHYIKLFENLVLTGKPAKFVGKSFILNPRAVLLARALDDYKMQYIYLCSLRAYSHYKQFNERGLDLTYYPDLNISLITRNPLVYFENNTLKLKFEE